MGILILTYLEVHEFGTTFFWPQKYQNLVKEAEEFLKMSQKDTGIEKSLKLIQRDINSNM